MVARDEEYRVEVRELPAEKGREVARDRVLCGHGADVPEEGEMRCAGNDVEARVGGEGGAGGHFEVQIGEDLDLGGGHFGGVHFARRRKQTVAVGDLLGMTWVGCGISLVFGKLADDDIFFANDADGLVVMGVGVKYGRCLLATPVEKRCVMVSLGRRKEKGRTTLASFGRFGRILVQTEGIVRDRGFRREKSPPFLLVVQISHSESTQGFRGHANTNPIPPVWAG